VHENEKNDFFGFPKVKCLHVTGEVDKSVRCSCQIFFHDSMYQESLKSVNFDRLIQKIKRWTFFGTQCIKPNIGPAFVLYNTLYLPNPPHSFLLFPPTPSIAGRRFSPNLIEYHSHLCIPFRYLLAFSFSSYPSSSLFRSRCCISAASILSESRLRSSTVRAINSCMCE